MYFYQDPAPKSGLDFSNFDLSRIDGSAKYLEHYSNLLILMVFAKEGSRTERSQAEKEIAICNRKLAYWKRHPRYNQEAVTEGCLKLKREWRGRV